MKHILTIIALFCIAIPAARAASQPNLYSANTPCWLISGKPGTTTWIYIQTSKEEAEITGVVHISVFARKNGSHDIRWLCAHIAITTEALQRSVIRPIKGGTLYPERYFIELHQWQEDNKKGTAKICTTTVTDYLNQ